MLSSVRVLRALLVTSLAGIAACGDDGTDPDEFDPADLIGIYALSPAPQVTCDLDELGTATLTIDTVEVEDADDDELSLNLPVRVQGAFIDTRQDVAFTLPFDSGDQEFGGSTVIDMDIPVGITTVHAEGEIGLDGAFDDVDSFDASILSDVDVAIGSNTPTPCSSLDIDVTGTRVD